MIDSSRAWLTIVADNNDGSDDYDDGLGADHSGATWDVQVPV